jgi:hypothetical protein
MIFGTQEYDAEIYKIAMKELKEALKTINN